jgi:hypothetical protein
VGRGFHISERNHFRQEPFPLGNEGTWFFICIKNQKQIFPGKNNYPPENLDLLLCVSKSRFGMEAAAVFCHRDGRLPENAKGVKV